MAHRPRRFPVNLCVRASLVIPAPTKQDLVCEQIKQRLYPIHQ